MKPDGVSIELELSQAGYDRLCRLAERMARIGGNPDMGSILAVAIMTGVEAQEVLLDRAEAERRAGRY